MQCLEKGLVPSTTKLQAACRINYEKGQYAIPGQDRASQDSQILCCVKVCQQMQGICLCSDRSYKSTRHASGSINSSFITLRDGGDVMANQISNRIQYKRASFCYTQLKVRSWSDQWRNRGQREIYRSHGVKRTQLMIRVDLWLGCNAMWSYLILKYLMF